MSDNVRNKVKKGVRVKSRKEKDNVSLISSFRRAPRGGIEEDQFRLLHASVAHILLSQIDDRWVWNLESSGDFSVKSARSFIDDSLLPKADSPTRWVKVVPIKINIFGWRVCLDKLPTRLYLSLRGVDIPSILCPLCSIAVESSSHLLFSCQLARLLMLKVARCWELEVHSFNSYGGWLIWFNNIRLPSKLKEILEGTCYVLWSFQKNLSDDNVQELRRRDGSNPLGIITQHSRIGVSAKQGSGRGPKPPAIYKPSQARASMKAYNLSLRSRISELSMVQAGTKAGGMGPLSDGEPMREGESIWEKGD
ncbi:RNA-directed DNA polymerase, eukaryota [Tanacetum coccineum]|uniref:RNA-directed DNA polymerase, eukaryota n=1 Tax=Tanacetum coccineum TaxID=301880 RepID=A0ABQ5IB17_9ASTR